MASQIPDAGAVNDELAREIHVWWQEAAERTDIDLSGFDADAPLGERVTWALEQGLDIDSVGRRTDSE